MKSSLTVSLVEEARGGPFVLWESLPTAIAKTARLGFDAIEIFPPSPDAIREVPLKQLLADHGLALAAVGTGAGWVKHRLSLADPDPAVRTRAVDFVRSIIDVAAELGASAIIGSMQGRSGNGVSREASRDHLIDSLGRCARAAAEQTPLLYEPLNRYETDQACTLADGAALLGQLESGLPVRLLADLFHMGIEETDVAAAIRAHGDSIGHVHFVDSNRRPVGCGHTDFGPIVRALREVGYQGYLSAEAFPYPDSDAAAAQTIRAHQYWVGASA
ncbi:MAG: sugar phosphate isomerase/epimerase [Planctomycetaceae bacterium]|nr:MAG: sugar phosphate isomerase/epimerase [Planctomycetaceae bacterium]